MATRAKGRVVIATRALLPPQELGGVSDVSDLSGSDAGSPRCAKEPFDERWDRGGADGLGPLRVLLGWRRPAKALATGLLVLAVVPTLLCARAVRASPWPSLPGPSASSLRRAALEALGLGDYEPSPSTGSVTADDIESSVLLLGNREDARADGARIMVFRSRPRDKLGNAMMAYWNARALAFLEGLEFRWLGPLPQGSDAHIIEHLPRRVLAGVPSRRQRQLYELLKSPYGPLNVCWGCPYPQAYAYAPWHLLLGDELRETVELVARLRRTDNSSAERKLHGVRSAVVHLRCDEEILGGSSLTAPGSARRRELAKSDYGLLPHRFVLENLPANVEEVTLVSRNETFDPSSLCGQAVADLEDVLQVQRVGLVVRRRSSSARSDWLFLATAPVLLCAPSTFCVTAALGNPNTVFVPVNGLASAVAAPGPRFGRRQDLSPPGFHWVDTDYAPGKYLWNASWEALQRYLRSPRCAPSDWICVPCCARKRLRGD